MSEGPTRRKTLAASFITAAAMVYVLDHSQVPSWTFAPLLLAMAVITPLSSWLWERGLRAARWALDQARAGPWQIGAGYGCLVLALLQLFFFLDLSVALRVMPYTGLTWDHSNAPEQVAMASVVLLVGALLTACVGVGAILWYRREPDDAV